MKTLKGFLLTVVAGVVALCAAPVVAQTPGATVSGHVQNAAGQPLTKGDVTFTKDRAVQPKDAKMLYTAPLDANGDYKIDNVAPGDYALYVQSEGKFIDHQDLSVKGPGNLKADFDMTRAEYLKGMTDEERKQLEEFKKKNSEATQANKVIANLNATLKSVRDDLHTPSPNFDKDEADMREATTAKPDESILWIQLGDVLAGKGDHLAADDKKAGKPAMSDDAVLKAYSDAVDAYKKGIDLNAASKKPNPADQAIAWSQMGNTLAREGKVSDAQAAYESAAKLEPTNAGMYYNNEAAVLYNAAQSNAALNDGVLAAAEKAIEADPKRPDPYYIKAQMLLQKATLDPKTQKLTTPPGCVDAYQAYLSLDPNGKYSASVKEVLASLGEKIDTHYRAPGASTHGKH
jgi:tetratricopeptide (TPR) repeat protein